MQVDTKAAFHWEGGLFNVSLLNLHGDNYSTSRIGALQTISGVQGDRATRLWELWYDQKFGDQFRRALRPAEPRRRVHDRAERRRISSIRYSAGRRCTRSTCRGGGPAFPLSALGVRGRWQSGPWTALAGVFSGEPAPETNADPQHANPYGLASR